MSLKARRLHIVIGKGGVGKSTLSAALALALQAKGKRVLVCEVTAKERVAPLLAKVEAGPELRQVDENIWCVHIRPPEAMREYGLMVLKIRAIYSAVFENRLVRYFLRAIPSLPEIVMLGKVWWHVTQEKDDAGKPRWDAVVLDAPATGHGLTFLGVPKTVLALVEEGPLMRDLRQMRDMVTDAAGTAAHLVALPEDMPVNEAIELHEKLSNDLGVPGGLTLLNAAVDARFTDAERADVLAGTTPDLEPARDALRQWGARQDLTARSEEKLRASIPLPVVKLPFVVSPDFDRAAVQRLADVLGPALEREGAPA